jgi:hypothetical protein
MLSSYDIPVAYSMVELARQSEKITQQPFTEFMCYWTAFNNIYTTIAEQKGFFARLRTQRDGTIRVRENGSVFIPEVEFALKTRDEIVLAFNGFSESLKNELILHPNTEFFVYRTPSWHSRKIEIDENGQRLNGVINIRYTIDEKHPVWSPIDIEAYERYTKQKPEPIYRDLLAKQILFLIYTIRNNTFHGGKRADDANDIGVVNKALPLLKLVVESYM